MEICQRCKETGEDRRTLWMACFYEMNELGLPFKLEIIPDEREREGFAKQKHHFYTLRVCKQCRADWMQSIKQWFDTPKQPEQSCGSGIYIRRKGVNVEITREEWDAMSNGKEPVILRSNND